MTKIEFRLLLNQVIIMQALQHLADLPEMREAIKNTFDLIDKQKELTKTSA